MTINQKHILHFTKSLLKNVTRFIIEVLLFIGGLFILFALLALAIVKFPILSAIILWTVLSLMCLIVAGIVFVTCYDKIKALWWKTYCETLNCDMFNK